MGDINTNISRVRSLLLNPQDNAPTLDQLWSHLTMEMQNFYNELSSSFLPWTYHEQSINVTSGLTDYLVTEPTGKILFVIAYPENTDLTPVSLEFADLADVSSDFYLYSPLDYGYTPDFNESINFPFPFQIAFYRKDNDLYFRVAPFSYNLTSIKIIYSTGDWLTNLQFTDSAVLPQHHGLVEVRTALNLLPAAKWTGDASDQDMRANLGRTLAVQEGRYNQQFILSKRNITIPETTMREDAFGGGW